MTYTTYLERKRQEYGDTFDDSALDSRFAPYFHTGTRLKIQTHGLILTGMIGVTTGWKPCFLLMRTARSRGSSWTLGPNDEILAIQHGRTYHPLAKAEGRPKP